MHFICPQLSLTKVFCLQINPRLYRVGLRDGVLCAQKSLLLFAQVRTLCSWDRFLLEHLKKSLALTSPSKNDHTLWGTGIPSLCDQQSRPLKQLAVCMHSQHAHTCSVNPQCGLR